MDPLLIVLIILVVGGLLALTYVSMRQMKQRDRELPKLVAERTTEELLRRLEIRPGELKTKTSGGRDAARVH